LGWVTYGSPRLILVGLGNLWFLQVKHVIYPPPNFYQSCQSYRGNPYAIANSDDDSNDNSNDVPAAANVSAAVADMSATAICDNDSNDDSNDVPSAPANVSAAITDVNPVVGDRNAVIANVNAVSADFNYATAPYYNLISAARHESTGRSVEHSM
jgi:hypothetical protein